MTFSLVLATVNRTEPLYLLLNSLAAQTHQDFKLIVIDQNPDDRVTKILSDYQGRFPIVHVRAEKRGKAHANNVGLEYADGEVIHFPDDDAWYPNDLFERVEHFFRNHPEYGGFTGRESNGKWDTKPGSVTKFNVWRRHISFTMFFRREAVRDLRFDEELGVGAGSKWGAGEDTDFLLRGMRRSPIYYHPEAIVFHPEWANRPFTESKIAKARSYGMGMGHVLRIHSYPLLFASYHALRPAAHAVVSFLRNDPEKARFHWAIFQGRLRGWLETRPEEVKAW